MGAVILNELLELSRDGTQEVSIYGSFFNSKYGISQTTTTKILRKLRDDGFIEQKIDNKSFPTNLRIIKVNLVKVLEKLDLISIKEIPNE